MPPPVAAPRLTPESRVSLFYFVLFMSAGLTAAFAGIWLEQKGLSTREIGVINTGPILVLVLINLFVGRLADRASDWKRAIIFGSVAAAVFSCGLFLDLGFWGILLAWTLSFVAQGTVVPICDAAATRLAERRGTDFARMRGWGTVGYLLVILISGYAVVWFGVAIFVPVFVALSILRAFAACSLPRFRRPPDLRVPPQNPARLSQVMKPWFLLPLIGWSMVFSTHLILNAFQGLLFQRQGIALEVIGQLIALGAASEAAMFFLFRRLLSRFQPLHLMLASAVISASRWAVMALSPGVGVLYGLQSLHALTFAIGFLGCMNFITSSTSEEIAAEAQSLFATLQQVASILAIGLFGLLAGSFGAHAYFASAAIALTGGALILLALRQSDTGPGATIPL